MDLLVEDRNNQLGYTATSSVINHFARCQFPEHFFYFYVKNATWSK